MTSFASGRVPLAEQRENVTVPEISTAAVTKKMSTFEKIFRTQALKSSQTKEKSLPRTGETLITESKPQPEKERLATTTRGQPVASRATKSTVAVAKKRNVGASVKPATALKYGSHTCTSVKRTTRLQQKAPKAVQKTVSRVHSKERTVRKKQSIVGKKPSSLSREERIRQAEQAKKQYIIDQRRREKELREKQRMEALEKERQYKEDRRLSYEDKMKQKAVLAFEQKQRRIDDAKRRKEAHDAQVRLKIQKKEEEKAFRHDIYKTRIQEKEDVLQYRQRELQKRRQSIMIRAKEVQHNRSIKKQTAEERLITEVENLEEKKIVDMETKKVIHEEEKIVSKDIIQERKRLLEMERRLKSEKKEVHALLEKDMIDWENDIRLHEEELEASRRYSVMPIASTGIKKLNRMWKVFHEACKEEATNPNTM